MPESTRREIHLYQLSEHSIRGFLHNVEEKVESESSKVVKELNMLSSQEPVG